MQTKKKYNNNYININHKKRIGVVFNASCSNKKRKFI